LSTKIAESVAAYIAEIAPSLLQQPKFTAQDLHDVAGLAFLGGAHMR
jgi:hypothetical protein